MIFEGRSLGEVSDDEIANLVDDHVSERQHLEFKATFSYRDDGARLELLRDIVSMANGGGGYLLFGVRDDGHGRAQTFAEPDLMARSDSMIQSIRGLCHDHIADRIEGIEIRSRSVKGNTVVIVRIPVSARRPHMVTLHGRTDFWTRIEDGKRQMSLAEIREAFLNEPIRLRLDKIEAGLSDLAQTLTYDQRKKEFSEASTEGSDVLLRTDDGSLLADVMRERFEQEVGSTPFLWLGATPVAPRPSLIPVDQEEIGAILSAPPESRRDGWNMGGLGRTRRRSLTGVELGAKAYKYLEVFENGHMEFWAPLDDRFCWMQSEEERRARPRLYPYPVVEYPVSFLRLAAALMDSVGYSDEVLLQLEYRNVRGYSLRPGQPDEIRFLLPDDTTPFDEQHLRIAPRSVSANFRPDEVAFDLLVHVYRAFGVAPEGIPFRDSGGAFSFGQ